MTDAVPDGPGNVLLVGSERPGTEEVCLNLLSWAAPSDTHLLSVTFDESPDYLVGLWRADQGELPAETGVIDVGGETRSAAGSAALTGPGPAPVSIDVVSDPADLTGLSMAVSRSLDAWGDVDAEPVLCFHSLSSWLSQTDEERVFEFIHTVVGRFREIGARGYFHVDPEVHGEETINRFSALVDAVLEVGDDGSKTVRRRRLEA